MAHRAAQQCHRYGLYGLLLETPQPIPGLAPCSDLSPESMEQPVQIAFGPVPKALACPEYQDVAVQATGTAYLFSFPGVLRLFIEHGARITVEPVEDCDPVLMWTLILGAGTSVVGFQRGHVPLHASAIQTGAGCFAFAGPSARGKSTLAGALIERGFAFHADDLCLTSPQPAGGFRVGRGVPVLRLWDDAVDILGWAERTPVATFPNMPKSVYRQDWAEHAEQPLRRIYVLEFADAANPPGFYPVRGVDALQTLLTCLRMRIGLLSTGDTARNFERLTAIVREVEMVRFVRPNDKDQLHDWTERLADHIRHRA